jgi:hypothetical protein
MPLLTSSPVRAVFAALQLFCDDFLQHVPVEGTAYFFTPQRLRFYAVPSEASANGGANSWTKPMCSSIVSDPLVIFRAEVRPHRGAGRVDQARSSSAF